MSKFHDFVAATLADRKITDEEVPLIRAQLCQDGQLNLDDVKLLVELYCTAGEHCPAFAELFFEVLEQVILADGEIQPAEQFYLLKMLYSDRVVREREKQFLLSLRHKARRLSPEFEALCETALGAEATDWDVGGRQERTPRKAPC